MTHYSLMYDNKLTLNLLLPVSNIVKQLKCKHHKKHSKGGSLHLGSLANKTDSTTKYFGHSLLAIHSLSDSVTLRRMFLQLAPVLYFVSCINITSFDDKQYKYRVLHWQITLHSAPNWTRPRHGNHKEAKS